MNLGTQPNTVCTTTPTDPTLPTTTAVPVAMATTNPATSTTPSFLTHTSNSAIATTTALASTTTTSTPQFTPTTVAPPGATAQTLLARPATAPWSGVGSVGVIPNTGTRNATTPLPPAPITNLNLPNPLPSFNSNTTTTTTFPSQQQQQPLPPSSTLPLSTPYFSNTSTPFPPSTTSVSSSSALPWVGLATGPRDPGARPGGGASGSGGGRKAAVPTAKPIPGSGGDREAEGQRRIGVLCALHCPGPKIGPLDIRQSSSAREPSWRCGGRRARCRASQTSHNR